MVAGWLLYLLAFDITYVLAYAIFQSPTCFSNVLNAIAFTFLTRDTVDYICGLTVHQLVDVGLEVGGGAVHLLPLGDKSAAGTT